MASWKLITFRTLCKPPCFTIPFNLTLPHTFRLCAWVTRSSEWAHCKVSGYHQSLYQRKMAADFKWVNCFFKTRVLGQCCFISRQLSLFIVSFYRTAQPLKYYRQFLVRSSCKLQLIKVTSRLGKVQFCQLQCSDLAETGCSTRWPCTFGIQKNDPKCW